MLQPGLRMVILSDCVRCSCFGQNEATESTFGFVLPTEGKFSDEFMAQITVPLPYGFVGFGIANGTEIPPHTLTGLMTRFTVQGQVVGTLQTAMLVQQTALSADNSQLVPNASGGLVSLSSLSTWNATAPTFIFRCQNCSLANTATPVEEAFNLVLFQSYELPEYPAPDALNASLTKAEVTISGFTVGNIRAFRNGDYGLFLKSTGFT
ncbi:hypothetical protein B0H10DRAFT_813335 [Mycena sp. CBHHK59/15]|nr:hypothetical protein B0H10DRAFT_906348 [Mycena sp. CBHHK59/15]KAJ6587383.1 hypothetical protein B0H10DRAFT_813335 [Mycena sp. CBHHK59/15]